MDPEANGSAAPAASAPKKFEFKPSSLTAVADRMWDKSKKDFFANKQPHKPIHLETKTLTDVLTKYSAEKEQQKATAPPTYIFGRGLADRVITDNEDVLKRVRAADGDMKTASELFQNVAKNNKETDALSGANGEQPTLVTNQKKSVFGASEQQSEKPTTSVVPLTTGEEDEDIVFQTQCKIHSFDKQRRSWVEKGMSNIRINRRVDESGEHHRIVARTAGTQRVVINSKIFPTMLLERVDDKRTKLSAMDVESNSVQIFLISISFSKSDTMMDQLFSNLSSAIEKEKKADDLKRKRKADDNDVEAPKAKDAKSLTDNDEKSDETGDADTEDAEESDAERSARDTEEEAEISKKTEHAHITDQETNGDGENSVDNAGSSETATVVSQTVPS